MAWLQFKAVWGKNFLSFEDFKLVFKTGKTLIVGINNCTNFAESNGSGKSSLIEAISWCIYGKTLREKNVSRNKKGSCSVGVAFSKGGDDYEVVRYLDKKGSSKVKISCNGDSITPRNNENVEDVILRTIDIPFDLFIIMVTVLQGLPINLSTMTPTIRKGVLEALMGLDNWDTFSKVFKTKRSEVEQDFEELDEQYSSLEGSMIAKNAEIEATVSSNEKVESDDTEDLKAIKKQLSDARSNVNYFESKREMCSTEDVSKIREDIRTLRSSCTTIENSIQDLIDLIEDEICPTCGQKYPVTMVESAKKKLEAHDAKLPKIKAMVKSQESLLEGIIQMDSDILVAKRELRVIEGHFNNLVARMAEREEDSTVNIDELKKELKEMVVAINELNAQIADINLKRDGLDYFISLLLPSSTFRTKVLERYLSFVNGTLSEICPNILDGITVSLEVDKKANGIDIVINDGKRGYKSLSGGEKRRVDIICILSLQKFLLECTGISTNLLMFDEIFDSLDAIGIQMILNAIDTIFDEDVAVYVITHRTEFRSNFESIIEVEKYEDISRIMEAS